MKKKKDPFEKELEKIHDVENMLRDEGKSDGECRYFVVMATRLLLIEDSLRVIRLLLFGLAGFLIGHLLA